MAYKRPHPSILCAQTPHSYDLQEQRANESYRISGASVFVTESEYKHNSHTTLIILEPSHFFQLRVLFCLLHFIHHTRDAEKMKNKKNDVAEEEEEEKLHYEIHYENHIFVEKRTQRVQIRRHLSNRKKWLDKRKIE